MAKLIFTYGAMNSAKSASLIMQAYSLRANGKNVLIVKPTLDDRDGDVVKSRAVPTELKADLVVEPSLYGAICFAAHTHKPHIVLVDEAQFLTTKQVEELAYIVDTLGITVQAYGLMTDFRGELFAGSKRLVELADVVERVRSECTECSNEGIINARFIDGKITLEGEQIVTGAEETYRVLCRKCFSEYAESD
jgi:thymidine kinase